MITTITVTSKDGIAFTVQYFARNAVQARASELEEARFARTRLAAELDSFAPEYQRVDAHRTDVITIEPKQPRVSSRPALTLIAGGKS